jgi:predicted KAP-like P-loop ATPase
MTQTAAVSPYDGHILLDVPALNPALGYANIASALASIIQSSEPRFAVGIFGSWGSGKSTLMESLAREIDTEHAIVVTFNAWQYEREVHIVLPLLDTIREGLTAWAEAHPDARGEAATHIARAIARVVGALARGFSAKVGIPGAVELGVDAGKVLDALSAGRQDDEGSPQSMYFAAFTELRAAFQRVRTAEFSRIVVFVDDLDRCLPASALSVIESMKLFFDLPGFVFVVGMDTRVIERAVRVKFREDFRDDGVTDVVRELEREYVNKIVQVQCTLPEMVPTQLDELLTWLDTNVRLG